MVKGEGRHLGEGIPGDAANAIGNQFRFGKAHQGKVTDGEIAHAIGIFRLAGIAIRAAEGVELF